jgi:hypothetical protein
VSPEHNRESDHISASQKNLAPQLDISVYL